MGTHRKPIVEAGKECLLRKMMVVEEEVERLMEVVVEELKVFDLE